MINSSLFKLIMERSIPAHIAIILDGNGRWAKRIGQSRSYGHKVGFDNIKTIAIHANSLGVKVLSLYCFSTENWKRDKDEVSFLMSLPITFKKDIDLYIRNNIKVVVSGRKDRIPKNTLSALDELVTRTSSSTGLVLNICFDYGALSDIKYAINSIIKEGLEEVDENTIYNYLSTKGMPLVDMVIRTGGEKRLSNFLLLESSYAELFFIDKYWPEFSNNDLDNLIIEYMNRDRRYGGIK